MGENDVVCVDFWIDGHSDTHCFRLAKTKVLNPMYVFMYVCTGSMRGLVRFSVAL